MYLENPEVGPKGGRHMKILIASPAQDAVIEKILRARGKWDPPWTRKRPARTSGRALSGVREMPSSETRINMLVYS